MPALVSIIIPAYNAARWIEQTIASALAQTWSSLEIIIVDDGSTDDTLDQIRRHRDQRIKVITSENRGAAAARNVGLAAAQGEFIQYLDADDMLSSNKIAVQIERLATEPSGVLATSGLVFFNDGDQPRDSPQCDGLPHAGDCDSPLDFLLRLYGHGGSAGMIQTSQWLVPRAVAEAAGRWDETLSVDDDGEYFARVVEHSAGVRYASQGRVYYRKHPNHGSLSNAWRQSEVRLGSAIRSLHGKRAVLSRLGAGPDHLRVLAPFYCEWALAAYPYFPALTEEALKTAQLCGVVSPRPQFPTPKGRALQALVGWRLARRVQVLLA